MGIQQGIQRRKLKKNSQDGMIFQRRNSEEEFREGSKSIQKRTSEEKFRKEFRGGIKRVNQTRNSWKKFRGGLKNNSVDCLTVTDTSL